MDTEVNAYSPICLPTKMNLPMDFVDADVKVTGYGYTKYEKDIGAHTLACKLQVGNNVVVPPELDACKRVC